MSGSAARRAPGPDARRRDADRTRAQLLEAASEIFAAKGLSGARVQEIATRAGVDKQLISYYFGGKDGLYAEVLQQWRTHEQGLTDDDRPLAEVAVRYLRQVLADPRATRLSYWHERDSSETTPTTASALHSLGLRKERGELPPDSDEAALLLVITGMVTVAATMPALVEQLFGVPPTHPDFESRYVPQVQRLIGLLTTPRPDRL